MLQTLKPKARNSKGVGIDELFIEPPAGRRPARTGAASEAGLVHVVPRHRFRSPADQPLFPETNAKAARIDKAVTFVTERLNGEDGLGARFFPAMAKFRDDVRRPDSIRAIESRLRGRAGSPSDKLLVIKPDEAYCQP